MTIKNKKDLSSSIEQLEKAINKQETILKKFDNEQLDFEQIKKLENLLIQEREKAKQYGGVYCPRCGKKIMDNKIKKV